MDQRLKRKIWYHKTPTEKKVGGSYKHLSWQLFFGYDTSKSTNEKSKKGFCIGEKKKTINKLKYNLENGRKYLQTVHKMRGQYLKHIRNSYNIITINNPI